MIRLAAVINTFEAQLLAQFQDRLRPEHYRALAAMKHCRTQASPKMQVNCTECEHQILVPHSCGHRHCPHCQHHESQQWLERQLAKQVPAQYYLLTFTLPAEFRALAWAHQRSVYDLLLRGAWQNRAHLQPERAPASGCPRCPRGVAYEHPCTRVPPSRPSRHARRSTDRTRVTVPIPAAGTP